MITTTLRLQKAGYDVTLPTLFLINYLDAKSKVSRWVNFSFTDRPGISTEEIEEDILDDIFTLGMADDFNTAMCDLMDAGIGNYITDTKYFIYNG